jgi:hypothetical protein
MRKEIRSDTVFVFFPERLMRFVCAVLVAVAPYFAVSQQPAQLSLPPESAAANTPVYDLGHEITPPQLLPSVFPTSDGKSCEKHIGGKVILNMQVNAQGVPVFIYFIDAVGNGLDLLALMIAERDRFNPAARDGVAVPVRQSLEMDLRGCSATTLDASGHPAHVFRLEAQPSQKFGPARRPKSHNTAGVFAPIPIHTESLELANKTNTATPLVVSLAIDEHGLPHDPAVVSPVGYRLDDAALNALNAYRFVPAIRDGKPVAFHISFDFGTRMNTPPNLPTSLNQIP